MWHSSRKITKQNQTIKEVCTCWLVKWLNTMSSSILTPKTVYSDNIGHCSSFIPQNARCVSNKPLLKMLNVKFNRVVIYFPLRKQHWTFGNRNMLYHPTSYNFRHTSVQDACICPWEGANDLMTGVWVHPFWKRECVFSLNLNPNLPPLLFRQLPPQPHRLPFV